MAKEFTGVGYRGGNLNEAAFIQPTWGDFVVHIELSWLDPVRKRILETRGSASSAVVERVDQHIFLHEADDVHQIEVKANNTIRTESLNFLRSVNRGKNAHYSAIVGARTVKIVEKGEEGLIGNV